MTPVWLDDLAPVAVADRCKAEAKTQHNTVRNRLGPRAARDTHPSDARVGTDLRRPCGCTGAGCWQLSTGSPAATRASPPSRSAPCQPWAGRTGGAGAKGFERRLTERGLLGRGTYLFGGV